jgi:hypothetical protein
MAKLTVYIPDELLERARARDPGANTSQLVQRGLEQLSPSNDAPYARRPADADKLLAEAREKLNADATLEYERGYRAALVTAASTDKFFYQLDDLADVGFDILRWLRAWHDRKFDDITPSGESRDALAKDLGGPFLDDPQNPLASGALQTRAFMKGYGAALREAWEGTERPAGQSLAGYAPDAEHEKEIAQET